MRTSCPAIRMYLLNTSDGTPKPATWPMWRGPLAYGQATALSTFDGRTRVMGPILFSRSSAAARLPAVASPTNRPRGVEMVPVPMPRPRMLAAVGVVLAVASALLVVVGPADAARRPAPTRLRVA